MNEYQTDKWYNNLPSLSFLPISAKILITAVLLTLGVAMVGAVGQIMIHDILPTFFPEESLFKPHTPTSIPSKESHQENEASRRGDLFSDLSDIKADEETIPFYKTEKFIWTLKFSHIHLFGMNMIFIFMGCITLMLDLKPKIRGWLIALPFAGVLIDIAAVWLKVYVSPTFFWLHLPGGNLFATIFIFVFFRALWEMWITSTNK